MEALDGYLSHFRRPLSNLFQRDDDSQSSLGTTPPPPPPPPPSSTSTSSPKPTYLGRRKKNSNRKLPSLNNSENALESESESDSDDDSDDEMELIGKFSFAPFFSNGNSSNNNNTNSNDSRTHGFMSLEHYHWLIQRYLAPYGEPSGIVVAQDPEIPPPIGLVGFDDHSNNHHHHHHNHNHSHNISHHPSSSSLKGGIDILTEKNNDEDERKKRKQRRRRILLRKRRLSRKQSNNTTASNISGEQTHPILLNEQELRQKILEIKEMSLTDRERDRMVQDLMTANYYRIKGLYVDDDSDQNKLKAHDEDEGIDVADDDDDDDDLAEDDDDYDDDEDDDDGNDDNEDISLSLVNNTDRKPTYTSTTSYIYGCQHYLRGCKLQCSTCDKWYSCRICHDDVESHKLIRQQTRNMLCMNCGTAQPAGQDCKNCHRELARYYCDICKLWDDDPEKSIFHCHDCGICRIGKGLGKDFFHCKTCNVCMSIELENAHRCIEHSTECDCPICGEFMFTSTETVVFMKCGHPIHQSCYLEHVKTSYKCPTCQRSVINMEASFRILDAEINSQVLPEPYSDWRSIIVCNDCSARSNVPFHFLGLKCSTCRSYNTSQMKLIKPEEFDVTEADRALIASAIDLSDVTVDTDHTDYNQLNGEQEGSDSEAIVG